MSYQFREDVAIADVAFEAQAESLSQLFVEAGRATMNVMVRNLDLIQPKERRPLIIQADELDLLLVDFLQELIYYKDAEQLLLTVYDIQVNPIYGGHELVGCALGAFLDPSIHQQVVDVKAVTMHGLQVARGPKGWRAFVILDI